ncbi:MAG: hypothetical protein WCF68_12550 [Terriglobales bacterium]|jgi:hypothetical protein
MMLLVHLSDQAQGAIASGMFTLFVFSVQTALLYSRFETRRKEELHHKEMEVKATYEKEVVKYKQLIEQATLDDKDRRGRMELLLNAAKSAAVGAEELSTTAALRAEQHNLRLSRTTSALQKVVEFLKEVETPRPLKPSDSERIKTFQASLINMISALDFDKYDDADYEHELTTRYRTVEASYEQLKMYTHNLAKSALVSTQ